MNKLYWKGRKIKNALLFRIKAFFHKRKDELESKKDDLLFEKSVMKEVIKAFIKNICIIALIMFLEQILVSEKCDGIVPYGFQKWIIKTNALVVEDRSRIIDVLSAIVGVAGVFLGLYCANIMSMYAEKYANAPQSISRLFENDIVSNKCIKEITNYLIFSVVVLFLQIIQIDIGIIMLIVLGVKALKIIVSFAFMSRRTYQFSDMYYVTNAVYKEIYRNLLHLNTGKMFTHDKNFQNYYKKQVKKCVGILAKINNYNLEKEEKISASVESFMKHNVALIYTYWQEKSKISYDSYWYDDKVVYKKWYSASDTEIEMALKTGTLLGYSTEKNYLWLEEDIEQINDNGLQYLINQKSFAGLIRWLGTLENLSERAVESGNVVYYVDYLYKIQKKLQNTIGKEKFSLEEEMALAEHIVVSYLGVLVGVRKYIEKWSEESCFCDVKLFERKFWKNPNRFYNYFDVNKIYDGVKAEIRLEKHRITPEWYINQVVAKHYYDELLQIYIKVNDSVNKYIPELAKELLNQNRDAGAMVVFAKYSEVKSKVNMLDVLIADKLDWLLGYHKEQSIVWNDKPEIDVAKNFDSIYKAMSSEWCKCTSNFVLNHWDIYEKYPDILGACATYLCDILIGAIVDNEIDTFASNYKNLLGILLLYQEYSKKELIGIKETFRQSAVVAVYSNPIIEYCMISGYAYLWGEISCDERWKELILEDAKRILVKDDMAKRFCEILSSVRYRMPAIHNRDVLHTDWKQRIENALKNSGNIIWKRDRFYEVYDGESKILKIVLSEKNFHNFFRYEAYEIYAIVILNQFVDEENRYHSRDGWEEKYYE